MSKSGRQSLAQARQRLAQGRSCVLDRSPKPVSERPCPRRQCRVSRPKSSPALHGPASSLRGTSMSGLASARRIPPLEAPAFAVGRRRLAPASAPSPSPSQVLREACPRPSCPSPSLVPNARQRPPQARRSRARRRASAPQLIFRKTNVCECEPRPLSQSKRGMGFHVSGGKQKGGAETWNLRKTSAVACTFVPCSKSPGIAVLVSNTGGRK
jgi:hypothetical protein